MLVWPSVLYGEQRFPLITTYRDRRGINNTQGSFEFANNTPVGNGPAAGHTRHVVLMAATRGGTDTGVITDINIWADNLTFGYVPMTLAANNHVVIDSVPYNTAVAIIELATVDTTVRAFLVDLNNSPGTCSIAVWTLEDLISTTPFDVAFSGGDDAASTTINLDIPGGGVGLAFAHQQPTLSGWTSLSGITERNNANNCFVGDVQPVYFQDEYAMTADPVDATTDHSVTAVSFL